MKTLFGIILFLILLTVSTETKAQSWFAPKYKRQPTLATVPNFKWQKKFIVYQKSNRKYRRRFRQ